MNLIHIEHKYNQLRLHLKTKKDRSRKKKISDHNKVSSKTKKISNQKRQIMQRYK